ncbi:MAG: sulfurtransferase TusA family protein [Deltaproteobacteria bacterium]|nr:sulfurtransferase TusA family protein [Deltaproteobacteria bacterium]
MTSSSPSASPPTSSSPGEPPQIVDIRGEVCPFTFVRTKLAIEAVAIGEAVRVITDHEPASHNIPRSATEWGQDVLGVTALPDGTWAIDLRRRVR